MPGCTIGASRPRCGSRWSQAFFSAPTSWCSRCGSSSWSGSSGRSLEDTSGADQRRYRQFQLSMIEPHCGPSVLEVGAGLGEFVSQFHRLERHVVTDVDPEAVAAMAERFSDRPEVEARVLDLG